MTGFGLLNLHPLDGVVETGLQNKRSNWVYTDNIVAGCRYLAQQHSNRAPAYRFQFDQVPQNQSIQIGATQYVSCFVLS